MENTVKVDQKLKAQLMEFCGNHKPEEIRHIAVHSDVPNFNQDLTYWNQFGLGLENHIDDLLVTSDCNPPLEQKLVLPDGTEFEF